METITKPTPVLEFEDSWGKETESKAPAKPIDIPVPGKEKEKTPPPINDDELPDIPGKKKLSANLSAELTVMSIDGIQSMIFKMINSRKIVRRIGKENIERFGELLIELKEGKKILDQLSDAEKTLFWKFRRLKQVEEDIPFTNEEYDKLTEVLEKYFEETQQQLPAWLALGTAITTILGARIADAITE